MKGQMMRSGGRVLRLAAAWAALLGVAGCRSVGTITPSATTDAGMPETEQVAAQESMQRLNVSVELKQQPPISPVAAVVRDSLSGALAEAGYTLKDGPADLGVSLTVGVKPFDRSGNFLVYEGTVKAAVRRVFDNKLLAQDVLSVKGERELGEEKALLSVSDAMAGCVAEWAGEAMKPARVGLAACDLSLARPMLTRYRLHDDEYARLVISELKKMSDVVLDARIVSQDYAAHTLVVRVVYFPDRVPEGILNRISRIEALNIRPR